MAQTRKKREDLPAGKKFTKDYQPAPKAKSEGWKKRRFSRDLIKEMLNGKFKFTDKSQVKKNLIQSFGEEVVDLTIGELMTLRQMHKAISEGDHNAYKTLVDQALGNPKQEVNNSGKTVIEIVRRKNNT